MTGVDSASSLGTVPMSHRLEQKVNEPESGNSQKDSNP
jgi:hypothetical protein